MTDIRFDAELLRRYDVSGPRYTSYPTAAQFHAGVGAAQYHAACARSRAEGRLLSLYFHLPFCNSVCFYCACNKIVTANRARAAPYVERVQREIAMQAELFGTGAPVEQLHWGGGTPTFLAHDEMRALMETTRRYFRLSEDGEYGVEIDPREVRPGTLALLRELGFNRLSLGVQDFDPAVQMAVNRRQSEALTRAVLEEARALGFGSINLDLIYGLPRQSTDSFMRTLDAVLALAPARLSVFNYAHLPELFKSQRQIDAAELPDAATKLDILRLAIERLTGAGYVYIGMDHFARPDDELAVAQRNGTLHRNFQGYSTRAGCDLVAVGVSAIGAVGDVYVQNAKSLPDYYAHLDAGRLALVRGVELNADDRLRRDVIQQLICHGVLDIATLEAVHPIRFADYFARERAELEPMRTDGLVDIDASGVRVQPVGRLLIRNICMVFDRYRPARADRRFSRVI